MNTRAGWTEAPLGYLVRLEGGSTPSKEEPAFWNGSVPWVSPKDMKRFVIDGAEDHVTDEALLRTSLRLVQPPAVLTVVRGMILAHTVPVARLASPVTLNQDMKAMKPARRLDAGFLAYALLARQSELLGLVEQAGHGTCCLRTEQLTKVRIAFPGLTQQRAIASFLDRKTAAIDALIAKKERLIQLLQEKRQAVITHAVTKGLDPGVKMKDSGVEWLGEVPAHWEVVRLKFSLRGIEQGWSPSCESREADEGEWGVLKAGCVNYGVFNERENKALPADLAPERALEVRPGDVLMSRANTRELLGSTALVTQVRTQLLLCDKLYRLRLRPAVADAEFVTLALATRSTRHQLERAATGTSSSMQNIGQDVVANLLLPRPPLAEQRAIAEYVANATADLATSVETARRSVGLLREYRQALITAAVTGQVEVGAEEMAA